MITHIAIIHLFHIIIVGWLFLYVGIAQSKIPSFFYPMLLILGIFIILYHGYNAYVKLSLGKNPWVSWIHILLVGPLLICIGYKNKNTPRYYYELLLMLGFAAIGYHGYYLLQDF